MLLDTPTAVMAKIIQGFSDNISKAKLESDPDSTSDLWTFPANSNHRDNTYTIQLFVNGHIVFKANSFTISGCASDGEMNISAELTRLGKVVLTEKLTVLINDLCKSLIDLRVERATVAPLHDFLAELKKGYMLAEDYVERR